MVQKGGSNSVLYTMYALGRVSTGGQLGRRRKAVWSRKYRMGIADMEYIVVGKRRVKMKKERKALLLIGIVMARAGRAAEQVFDEPWAGVRISSKTWRQHGEFIMRSW